MFSADEKPLVAGRAHRRRAPRRCCVHRRMGERVATVVDRLRRAGGRGAPRAHAAARRHTQPCRARTIQITTSTPPPKVSRTKRPVVVFRTHTERQQSAGARVVHVRRRDRGLGAGPAPAAGAAAGWRIGRAPSRSGPGGSLRSHRAPAKCGISLATLRQSGSHAALAPRGSVSGATACTAMGSPAVCRAKSSRSEGWNHFAPVAFQRPLW